MSSHPEQTRTKGGKTPTPGSFPQAPGPEAAG